MHAVCIVHTILRSCLLALPLFPVIPPSLRSPPCRLIHYPFPRRPLLLYLLYNFWDVLLRYAVTVRPFSRGSFTFGEISSFPPGYNAGSSAG